MDSSNSEGLNTSGLICEVDGNRLDEVVENALDSLLKRHPKPDALLFATDLLTLYGLKYAIRNNLNIPEEIEIMAIDEAPYYDIFPSKLSYYKQPLELMGRKAVDFLMSKIANDDGQWIQEIVKGEMILSGHK